MTDKEIANELSRGINAAMRAAGVRPAPPPRTDTRMPSGIAPAATPRLSLPRRHKSLPGQQELFA
jgi:hypothetical protein